MEHPTQQFLNMADDLTGVKQKKACCLLMAAGIPGVTTFAAQAVPNPALCSYWPPA
jgi:hypothetical protein